MTDWNTHVNEWREFENSLKYVDLPPSRIAGVWWEKESHEWVPYLILSGKGNEGKQKVEVTPSALKSLVSYLIERRFGGRVLLKLSLSQYQSYDPVFSELIRQVIAAAVAPPEGPEEQEGYQELCTSPPVGLFSHNNLIAVVSTKYSIVRITDFLSEIAEDEIVSGGWWVEKMFLSADVSLMRVQNPSGVGICFVNGYTGKTAARIQAGIKEEGQGTWIDLLSSETLGKGKPIRVIHRGKAAEKAGLSILTFFSPSVTERMIRALKWLKTTTVDQADLEWMEQQIPNEIRQEFAERIRPGTSALAAIQEIYRARDHKEEETSQRILMSLARAKRAGEMAYELMKRKEPNNYESFLDLF